MHLFRSCILSVRCWSRYLPRSNSSTLTSAQNVYQHEFSLESYDCVGFDLDHTICRYKLKPLFNLIYKTLANFLVEKYDYPKFLVDTNDSEMSFAQKGIILDKKRGNFLKLNDQYKIVRAYHGTRPMSAEDICCAYGHEGIWGESRRIPQKLITDNALKEPFYVFKDYFVTAGAVVCAKIVDILDSRNGGPLKEYSFWEHYLDGLFYMYERNNFRNNEGEFFPDLKANPHQYMKPCSDNVKNWLANICKNKVSFLLTSSNYDSAAFLAEFCLGKEWRNYFNVIVTFARKPGFFWKDKPFCMVNENVEISNIKPEDMKMHLIYSQGNWKDLNQVCSIISKVEHPKTLYFGDSLVEDVYAASEVARCDIVAIVEEMLAEGMESVPELHAEADVLLSKYWGSFFGDREEDSGKVESLSLWASILSQHSKLAIPNLDVISQHEPQIKAPGFVNELNSSGYFPGIPKILVS